MKRKIKEVKLNYPSNKEAFIEFSCKLLARELIEILSKKDVEDLIEKLKEDCD